MSVEFSTVKGKDRKKKRVEVTIEPDPISYDSKSDDLLFQIVEDKNDKQEDINDKEDDKNDRMEEVDDNATTITVINNGISATDNGNDNDNDVNDLDKTVNGNSMVQENGNEVRNLLPEGLPEMPLQPMHSVQSIKPVAEIPAQIVEVHNDSDNATDFTSSGLTSGIASGFMNTPQIKENVQYFDSYVNNGINIIDPTTYSPMVYVVDNQKMVYSNGYPFVYDVNVQQKKSSLPYAYVSRNSYDKPDFNIVQNKLKLYNYWIETNNIRQTEMNIIKMFGAENVYNTKSLFFRKKNSYMGEKVILVSKTPQKPYKFINRINRTFSKERRTVKSVLGDYIISPDCLFIILAERSIDYICNNYFRYHKDERMRIDTLIRSFKSKFTCITDSDIN